MPNTENVNVFFPTFYDLRYVFNSWMPLYFNTFSLFTERGEVSLQNLILFGVLFAETEATLLSYFEFYNHIEMSYRFSESEFLNTVVQ